MNYVEFPLPLVRRATCSTSSNRGYSLFANLETRRELGQVHFRKDLWDRIGDREKIVYKMYSVSVMNTSCLVLSAVDLGQITPLNLLPLPPLISFNQSTTHAVLILPRTNFNLAFSRCC